MKMIKNMITSACGIACAAALLARSAFAAEKWDITRAAYPQIVSHRGASGYIPEHSVNAYRTAIDLGADYIEPDLVVSKDGMLMIMHDLTLDDTTDVGEHPEFEDRYDTRVVGGKVKSGYFASDFNFTELRTLRLKQRLEADGRTSVYDGYFLIPTFQDALDLAQQYYDDTQKLIGVYTELKSPSYHHERGWNMEQMVLDQLADNGYLIQGAPNDMKDVVPIVLQCFEADSLKIFRELTDIPLVRLVEGSSVKPFSDEMLSDIASYADGMGPKLEYLTDMTLDDAVAAVERAHGYGLKLHPWTFRAEAKYIPAIFGGSVALEYNYFFCCLAIDGVFSEFPDQARQQLAVLQGASPQDCYTMCPELSPASEDDDHNKHDDDDDDDNTFVVLTVVFGAVIAVGLGLAVFFKLRANKSRTDFEAASLLP